MQSALCGKDIFLLSQNILRLKKFHDPIPQWQLRYRRLPTLQPAQETDSDYLSFSIMRLSRQMEQLFLKDWCKSLRYYIPLFADCKFRNGRHRTLNTCNSSGRKNSHGAVGLFPLHQIMLAICNHSDQMYADCSTASFPGPSSRFMIFHKCRAILLFEAKKKTRIIRMAAKKLFFFRIPFFYN